MSVQALSWVFAHSPTTGSNRLVLLALANYAGHEVLDDGSTLWECWPSIGRITHDAGLAREQTTRDVLRRLEAAGAITTEVQAAPDHRIRADRRTNLYRIVRVDGPTADGGTPEGGSSAHGPTAQVPRPHGSGTTAPRGRGAEPLVEPSPEPPTTTSAAAAEPSTDLAIPSLPKIPKGVDREDVDALNELLRAAIERHAKVVPTISAAWTRDMGTLLNSGGAGIDEPAPTVDYVRRVIEALFTRLAIPQGAKGFCWADQVQSPSALRRHWGRIIAELRKRPAGVAGLTDEDRDRALNIMEGLDDLEKGSQ